MRNSLLRPWYVFTALILLLLSPLLAAGAYATPASSPSLVNLANGALVRNSSNGRIFLIWDGTRHWIRTEATFNALGYSMANVQNLSDTQIDTIPHAGSADSSNSLALNTVANGLTWPLGPINASPVTVNLSEPSLSAGGALQMSAGGFAPGEPVMVTGPAVSFTVNAGGNGTVQAGVPVAGTVAVGLHHLYLAGLNSHLLGVALFYVIPSAPAPSLSTPSMNVAPGMSVPLSGAGFAPGEQVELFLNSGQADTTITTSGTGTFGPVLLTLPSSLPVGPASVLAFGTTSHQSARLSLTITGPAVSSPKPVPAPPELALQPIQTRPRALVHIAVTGFGAKEFVLIRLQGRIVAALHTGPLGKAGGMLRAPNRAGVYAVTAVGATSRRATSASLRVVQPIAPAMRLQPAAITPRAAVTIHVSGFAPREMVLIRLNGRIVTAFRTGPLGQGSGRLRAPAHHGVYQVRAIGVVSGRSVSGVLHVVSPARLRRRD
jgi:hypothetical protein